MQITPEMLDAMYDGACSRASDEKKLERVWPLIEAEYERQEQTISNLEANLAQRTREYEAEVDKYIDAEKEIGYLEQKVARLEEKLDSIADDSERRRREAQA